MPHQPEAPPSPAVRAFVAVNLDPALRDVLAGIQERLKATRADVGWVKPENLHLTLKFLGSVERQRLEAAADALSAAVRGYGSFRFVLGGLGAFPQPRAARVVWIGVPEGADRLAGLADRIDETLQPLGFPPEARPFTPHLTLGRVRGPGRREQLATALTSMPVGTVGGMQLSRIEMMQSDLRREGPRYSVLYSFELGSVP
jgi:2'-5' RNA ligase